MKQIESIQELHDRLYDVLIVVDDICKKNDVRYFLSGGTLLGAIRDKDFIPWDDDMDLEILAEEWPKMEQALKRELPSYMKIVYPNDYNGLFLDFVIRVVDTRYTIREKNAEDDACFNNRNYVGTDIFLWTKISSNRMSQKIFVLGYKVIYGFAMSRRYQIDYKKYSFVGKLQAGILSLLGKLMQLDKLHAKYKRYSMKYANLEDCRYRICLSEPFQYIKPYPSYLWDNVTEGVIRERKFPVPMEYDAKLRLEYGDYMKKPEKLEIYEQHMDEESMRIKQELLDKYGN